MWLCLKEISAIIYHINVTENMLGVQGLQELKEHFQSEIFTQQINLQA